MSASWFIIGNPSAGKLRPVQLVRILDRLTLAMPNSDGRISEYPGHAELLARKARQSGYDRFVVVGGDGSLNEVLNGLLSATAPDRPAPTVICLPAGSGNDWARAHRIPGKIPDFIRLLQNGHPTPVHAGRITFEKNERTFIRYFVNIAGMAYGAEVAKSMAGKRYALPKWSYLASAVQHIFTYQGVRLLLQTNGDRFEGDCFTLHIGIQPYAGGGMHLLPHVKNQPPELAVTLIEKRPWWRILLSLHYLYNGKITSLPFARGLHASEVRISHFDKPVPLEADGDFLGYSPTQMEVVPNAFYTLVPSKEI